MRGLLTSAVSRHGKGISSQEITSIQCKQVVMALLYLTRFPPDNYTTFTVVAGHLVVAIYGIICFSSMNHGLMMVGHKYSIVTPKISQQHYLLSLEILQNTRVDNCREGVR